VIRRIVWITLIAGTLLFLANWLDQKNHFPRLIRNGEPRRSSGLRSTETLKTA
jgi:hypothetical protein